MKKEELDKISDEILEDYDNLLLKYEKKKLAPEVFAGTILGLSVLTILENGLDQKSALKLIKTACQQSFEGYQTYKE